MLKIVHIAKVIDGIRLVVLSVIDRIGSVVLDFNLVLCGLIVELELDAIGRAVAVITEGGRPTIVTAEDVLALCRGRLFSVLTVADLSEQSLVSELRLDLVFFLAHGAFVQESIRLLLKRLDVVFVEQLGPIQLLYQLFVNARFAWRPLRAEFNVNEVEYPVLELFSLGLGQFAGALRAVVAVVQVSVHFLPNAQIFGLFRLV